MKKTYLFFVFLTLCLGVRVASAQIYANTVGSSSGVINPENAVDADKSNYAIVRTDVGVLNMSSLTLDFPKHGAVPLRAVLDVQSDGTPLTAEALQSITLYLYNASGTLLKSKPFSDLVKASLMGSTSKFKISIMSDNDSSNVGSVKITVNGLASVVNSLRVYDSYLATNCEVTFGDAVNSSQNVQNPGNAVTLNSNDYALLTPPLLAGSSFLDISFSNTAASGTEVEFLLGPGTLPIDLQLLQNISVNIYDESGTLQFTKSDFTLTNLQALDNGRYFLVVKTPKSTYNVARARINLTSLVNVTTLKVYNVHHSNIRPGTTTIKVAGTTDMCHGGSRTITAFPYSSTSPDTYEWYRNGQLISGATDHTYVATQDGSYYVIIRDPGGCFNLSASTDITYKTNCFAGSGSTDNMITQVYPNPFHSSTTLSLDKNSKGAVSIVITDKTGKLIEEYQTSGGSSLKILEKAPQGIYFVKIINGDSVQTQSVIKL